MITTEKIGQARTAIMQANQQIVYCPHCGKAVKQGLIGKPLAAFILELLDHYEKDEVRPRDTRKPADGNDKRPDSRRKRGRPKKAGGRS